MSVKAKFKVRRFESEMTQKLNKESGEYENVEVRTVVLAPVYGSNPDDENKQYWDATPSGEIRLGMVNPAAWRYFGLDEEHYVTFEKAKKVEAASA
jgi:hypothetical protein